MRRALASHVNVRFLATWWHWRLRFGRSISLGQPFAIGLASCSRCPLCRKTTREDRSPCCPSHGPGPRLQLQVGVEVRVLRSFIACFLGLVLMITTTGGTRPGRVARHSAPLNEMHARLRFVSEPSRFRVSRRQLVRLQNQPDLRTRSQRSVDFRVRRADGQDALAAGVRRAVDRHDTVGRSVERQGV